MAWRLNRQSECRHSCEGGNPLAAFVRAFELWLLKDSNDNLEGFFPTAL